MTSNYPRGDLHRLHLNTSQCLNAIIYIYIYICMKSLVLQSLNIWNESLNILNISLNILNISLSIWNESLSIWNESLNVLNISLNILNICNSE